MRIAHRRLGALFILLAAVPATAMAAQLPSAKHKLAALPPEAGIAVPALDHRKALAEDAVSAGKGVPLRYAVGAKVAAAARDARGKSNAGKWETLPDGRAIWRMAVHAPGARTVDFGFRRMFLPHGAELYVADLAGTTVRGPYTDADNTRAGSFWTPIVPGDTALVEVVLPATAREALVLELGTVHSGYRDVLSGESLHEKSLSCHIDSACPQGDALRNQIRGVAGYTFDGRGGDGVVCTGQLLNNARQDNRRLFSSARHCVSSQSSAGSVTVYWRYESPVCRPQGSAASGIPVSLTVAVPHTGGATLLATHAGTDMTLLELNTAIPQAANAFFNGWDRRDTVPSSSAVVHHSDGDEKRISFDFNPAVINNTTVSFDGINYVARGSVDVTYDNSTTEGGASGGGLFDQNGRVVGQLGGGPAGSCSTGITDVYGRFAVAWEGGGTPGSRLRDWLDPTNTGAQTLDGKNECSRPQIVLNATPGTGRAGEAVNYSAVITGTGPYTVNWDVDGDGVVDRTQNGVNGTATLAAVYPAAATANVRVSVTDANACSADAQRAIQITAPDLVATAQAPQQVCGDNDGAIEPGERWRVPVNLANSGGQAIAGGYAVFARGHAAAGGGSGFGYTVLDNTSGSCPFQFIDISAQPTLPLTAAGGTAPAGDDGRTAVQALGPGGFDFFGQTINGLVMSTNGYLSTDATDNGGDFGNVCAIDTTDGRLQVLHDDLVVNAGGGLRRAYFVTCPRPADAGATAGCTVFTWTNMSQFDGGGNAEFQAVLYDQTFEIVYQYRVADPDNGSDATVGMHDIGGNEQVQYSCNAASIPSSRSVCQFHPNAQPAALAAAPIRLFSPAVALPNLAAGAQAAIAANFKVDNGAACGSSVRLDYVGTVDNVSHSLRTTRILDTPLGAGGACQVYTGTCAEPEPAQLAPRDGLYSNLVRFGNGMGAFNIPVGGGRTIFGAQWYTGNRDRTPTWLVIQGDIADNQADVPVYRTIQGQESPPAWHRTIVGRAQVTYVSSTDYVATWTVDGVSAGERMTFLYGSNRPTPDRTGAWYYPLQSGWGLTVEDHFLPGGQAEQVIINYLFDQNGDPVWTIGGSPNRTSGTMAHTMARVHCPSCPSLPDYGSQSQPAGTVTYDYSSLTRGTYSTNLVFPAPVQGNWMRNNVPIEILTPTVPQ